MLRETPQLEEFIDCLDLLEQFSPTEEPLPLVSSGSSSGDVSMWGQ
jgi:hypothetical protein